MKRKTIKLDGEVDGTNFNNSHRAGAVPKYFRQTALIYFRCDSVTDDERLTIYEDFANTFRGEKTLQGCLRDDLKVWRLQLYLVIAVTFNCFLSFIIKLLLFLYAHRFARIMISRPSAISYALFTKRYVPYPFAGTNQMIGTGISC